MTRLATLSAVCTGILALGGCVERKLTITSQPTGALVYMNDREVGRTPVETDFIWYGNYDVQVRKEGFTTLDQPTKLKAPWWQIPPIDLFAELMPWHPTDRQKLHFTLSPRQDVDTPPEELVNRGLQLKPQLESPNRPTTTQPTTQP
ncbi:MAG TPA: PEGA domain-containing protein [Tepidisphaeraceae bacterium]